MKTKIILAILIVLFVVSFVYFIRINQNSYTANEDSSGNIAGQIQESTTSSGTNNNTQTQNSNNKISLSELSKHNSREDCWVAYDGKVYDITSYLPRHPSSAGKILPYCGSADAFAQAFTKQHGTSKVSMLLKVGTFIGDFDVIGNLENSTANPAYADAQDAEDEIGEEDD